jgi:hypothetical protein
MRLHGGREAPQCSAIFGMATHVAAFRDQVRIWQFGKPEGLPLVRDRCI